MKRIDIRYDGETYSVGNREFVDVQAEISAGLRSGELRWLEVNAGDGNPRLALLALSPGMPIALIPLDEPTEFAPGSEFEIS